MIICPICKKPSLMLDTGGITGKYVCKNCGYKGNLSIEIPDEILKFRYFFTSSGLLVICGKNAEQNEELIKKFTKQDDLVFHTSKPGSPFCVLKGIEGKIKEKKVDEKSFKEASLICASFSKEWKKLSKKIEVHAFFGKNIYKEKGMQKGTFGVKKIERKITLIPKLFICNINGMLTILPYKKNCVGIVKQGKKEKKEIIEEIKNFAKKNKLKISIYIESELPASNMEIVWKNKNGK